MIKTVALDNGVPATGPINTAVSVDKVTMGGAAWLRIRSRGIANLSGASREGIDTKDITLRKLTLQIDRVTRGHWCRRRKQSGPSKFSPSRLLRMTAPCS